MSKRQAIVIVDIGYGDAGKGATVDGVVRKTGAHMVVRYNGGAQAAHNVVTPDGRHHTFAQFGSGMFVPKTLTYLSRFMLIDPLAMMAEADALEQVGVSDAFARTTIDEGALIITPFQRAANRLKELARGDGRHGSCGRGIGEAMSDFLAHGSRAFFARDIGTSGARAKLEFIRDLKLAELKQVIASLPRTDAVVKELAVFERSGAVELCLARYHDFESEAQVVGSDALARMLQESGTTVFEGAQGVLIDEWYGFHPYTTWSTTTTKNALALLMEVGFDGPVFRLGVIRAYAVRHGPGPFVSEDVSLTRFIPDIHNGMNQWQREFRIGWFDLVATRYALDATGGVDGLAVTCLDRLEDVPTVKVCEAYRFIGSASGSLDQFFELEQERKICRIRKATSPDLAHQEALALLLGHCKPNLCCVSGLAPSGGAKEYLQFIECELGVPIVMTASGPTALDRQFFEPFPHSMR